VVVAVFITRRLMSYKKGIFEDPMCSVFGRSCRANHAMLVVGYGTDPILKKDFWLVL
jgi:Papain family cysteine protease